MSKKDYELIARVVRSTDFAQSSTKNLETLANGLANALERDNPKFDKIKFLTACGIDYHQEFNDGVKLSDIKLVGED